MLTPPLEPVVVCRGHTVSAGPDITSLLIALTNPAPHRLQFGRIGKVLEAPGQAEHLQLTFRYCCEERVRQVFGHDPNERSEPPPFTVFDFAHGVVWFTCDCRHVFGAIRTGGEELCRIRSGAQKWDIVEPVAHLSIVMMESYALKELSEAEMRRVEKHVASCRKCGFVLEEQVGWMAAMRSPFRRKVEKMIEDERRKRAAKR